jgi:signal transduction histidine kinase
LGTLCAVDSVSRTLKPHQREALDILARQVVTTLELRRTLGRLQTLNDDKDRFFSIIAHDLRSPFSGLLGLTDLMQTHGESLGQAETLKYIGMIHQAVRNLYALMENLLRWAMLERGQMPYQHETIPVSVLFDEVLAAQAEALNRKSISVVADSPPGWLVCGDRNMLETALRNLVSNAGKYTPTGGRITVSAARDGDELRLSVEDSGEGMAPGQLATLREGLKVSSQPGTDGESGTGLGLTLVRQFATRNGGRLELDSWPGRGTLATLVLPWVAPEQAV